MRLLNLRINFFLVKEETTQKKKKKNPTKMRTKSPKKKKKKKKKKINYQIKKPHLKMIPIKDNCKNSVRTRLRKTR